MSRVDLFHRKGPKRRYLDQIIKSAKYLEKMNQVVPAWLSALRLHFTKTNLHTVCACVRARACLRACACFHFSESPNQF